MPTFYAWLTGLFLLTKAATAQAPAEALRPAQTIPLGPQATLGGTLLLPNHNTVLLLTDLAEPALVAQCLASDGHTLWKTTLAHYGIPRPFLMPYSVFTTGNDLIIKELIGEGIVKNQRKAGGPALREGQVFIQRLDEQGHLTQQLFEPLPLPDGEKKAPSYPVLARYASPDGYTELVQEANRRRDKYQTREHEAEQTLFVYTYNLKTKLLSREQLVLPEVPKSSREYLYWYTDWAFLGHCQGHLYFCRRSLLGDTEKQPGRGPLAYHVYLTDEHGQAAAPNGFTTAMSFTPAEARPAYSGRMGDNGELSHIPLMMELPSKHVGQPATKLDSWGLTTGGMGSFYLDYATGEVLIYGEYTNEDIDQFHRDNVQGVFFRRFAPDGKLLAQSQTPYSAEMLADKKKLSFKSSDERHVAFYADPPSGQYHYVISPTDYYGSLEDFDLSINHDLRWQRYDYLTRKDREKRIFTKVYYTQPYIYLTEWNPYSTGVGRTYEHPQPTDPPVYAALEKLRQPSGLTAPYYLFYLSPTGPGTGLVVERTQQAGGALRIYTF